MQIIRLLKILCGRSKATAYGLSPAGVNRNVRNLTIISGKVRSEVEGSMWPLYALFPVPCPELRLFYIQQILYKPRSLNVFDAHINVCSYNDLDWLRRWGTPRVLSQDLNQGNEA